VVEDGDQAGRVPGEHAILTRYGTLNALALDLYSPEGVPNPEALAALRGLHHIREDIAFYLEALLDRVRPEQIGAVLMQENLDADIERVLGVRPGARHKHHAEAIDPARRALEPRATANLRRAFERDYHCLTRLYCWGKISPEVFARLL
jgi:plasmid stability protein